MLKWIKGLLKGALVLVLFLLMAGLGYEQWSRWSAARAFPPTGSIHEVDGRRLHLHCSGEGVPTVVLEAGLDVGGSLSWSNIYPELAAGSRVCSYDRAGIMWSEKGGEPRDAVTIAGELHALLAAASESPPYVMVGHSLGGPLMRVFDHRYPGEVAGFVFVDSSHPEQHERFPPEVAEMGMPSPLPIKTLAAVGFLRLTAPAEGPEALSEEAAAALAAFRPRSMHGALGEMAALDDVFEQAAQTGDLGDRPIVVLSAGRLADPLPPGMDQSTADRMQEVWRELQAELAALSTNSGHHTLPEASHYVHWDDPQAVVEAVGEVVEAVRSGTPVGGGDG